MTILIDRPLEALDDGGGPPGPRPPEGGGGEPPHHGPPPPLHAFRLGIWLAVLIASPMLTAIAFANFGPKHLSPALLSPPTATATVGRSFEFPVTDAGDPVPAVRVVGSLPRGITFTPGRDNVIHGTARPGTVGTYRVNLIATSALGTAAQDFVLTVRQ